MLRACKWAAACSFRRRIPTTHPAAVASLPSSSSSSNVSSFSTFSQSFSTERAGAEQEDWRKVGVFWDMENCSIPSALDPFIIRPNIERALRTSGFLGPISLAGYVNIKTICRGHTLESLTETGITVHHVPSSARDASDRALLIDLMFWTMKHRPPAHVLLISGDSDFSVLLHKLRLLGYNVLLAAPNNNGIPSALVHAASKIWVWPDIIIGEPEGLVAERHVPGTPLPENFTSRKKDGGMSKSSINVPEDLGYECLKESAEGNIKANLQGEANLRGGAWLPPYAVDRIVNAVKCHPGITLGELIKTLKAININPKLYGYHDYYHCLSRMDQLETRYTDGLGIRERVVFYLSSHVADKRRAVISSTKDGLMSCGLAGSKEASDGVVCSDKHEGKGLVVELEDVEGKTRRMKSPEQERINGASGTLGSWSSRLLRFIKGS